MRVRAAVPPYLGRSTASPYGVLSLSLLLSPSLSLPQCHAPHPEAPAAEERGERAVEAAVCVRAGGGLSDLPAGLARGPLLAVHQVHLQRSSTMLGDRALLPCFRKGMVQRRHLGSIHTLDVLVEMCKHFGCAFFRLVITAKGTLHFFYPFYGFGLVYS